MAAQSGRRRRLCRRRRPHCAATYFPSSSPSLPLPHVVRNGARGPGRGSRRVGSIPSPCTRRGEGGASATFEGQSTVHSPHSTLAIPQIHVAKVKRRGSRLPPIARRAASPFRPCKPTPVIPRPDGVVEFLSFYVYAHGPLTDSVGNTGGCAFATCGRLSPARRPSRDGVGGRLHIAERGGGPGGGARGGTRRSLHSRRWSSWRPHSQLQPPPPPPPHSCIPFGGARSRLCHTASSRAARVRA